MTTMRTMRIKKLMCGGNVTSFFCFFAIIVQVYRMELYRDKVSMYFMYPPPL